MSSKKFFSDIDMNFNSLKNFMIDEKITDPTTPKKGQMWFRGNILKFFDGSDVFEITKYISNYCGLYDGSYYPPQGSGYNNSIKSGNFWIASSDFSNTIGSVKRGFMIIALKSNPTFSSDYAIIQRNIEDEIIKKDENTDFTINEKDSVLLPYNTTSKKFIIKAGGKITDVAKTFVLKGVKLTGSKADNFFSIYVQSGYESYIPTPFTYNVMYDSGGGLYQLVNISAVRVTSEVANKRTRISFRTSTARTNCYISVTAPYYCTSFAKD